MNEIKTPRTDAAAIGFAHILVTKGGQDFAKDFFKVTEIIPSDFCRQLERDLLAMTQERDRLKDLIIEGVNGFGRVLIATSDDKAVRDWQKRCRKALKETKP